MAFKKVSTTLRGDWLPRFDFVLDYSAEEIWPLIVRWDRWIDNYLLTHLSGEVDQLGAVRKVSFMKDGKELYSFPLQIVQLVPNQRLVQRLGRPSAPCDGFEDWQGWCIFNLFSLGERKTLVSYETVCEGVASGISEEQAEAAIGPQAEADGAAHWQAHCIPEFKRLLACKK